MTSSRYTCLGTPVLNHFAGCPAASSRAGDARWCGPSGTFPRVARRIPLSRGALRLAPGRRFLAQVFSTIYSISREPQRWCVVHVLILERKRTRRRPTRDRGTIRRGQTLRHTMKGHGDILGGASLLSARCGGLCRLKPVRAPRPALYPGERDFGVTPPPAGAVERHAPSPTLFGSAPACWRAGDSCSSPAPAAAWRRR